MSLGNLKLIFLLFFFLSFSAQAASLEGNIVEIQILDKITSKVKTIEIKVNEFKKLESLRIEVYACYKKPPKEIPEDFVLLRIYDQIEQTKKELIYQGWMISSSPASTPFEHPIYDLWIKDCKIEKDF